MNYAVIKKFDIANGPGVRVSLFVSGCRHKCKNCFNKEAWDFEYGNSFNSEIQEKILKELGVGYIAGLSILGGEPFEPQNQAALLPFVREVKRRYPDKPIWCYTGFVLDEKNGVLKEQFKNTADTKELISLIDVLVDGPYVESKKDLMLRFRGSSNQRLINVPESLKQGTVVLWEDWQGNERGMK